MPTRTRDLYGFDTAPDPTTAPAFVAGLSTAGGGAPLAGSPPVEGLRTRGINPDVAPTTSATPAATEAKVGSPLNTLYGVDNESYLTDEQRKNMRIIQGKFDASLNRRDRALAQYGAPMLASSAEDEALARAIAGAQVLNYRPPDTPVDTTSGPTSGFGTVPNRALPTVPRAPGDSATPAAARPSGAATNAEWQRIMTGLTSIAPLLFGKDAWGNFINKGLFQTIKEAIFGKDAPSISDAQFESLVRGGLPTDATGGYILNPITGMPMVASPNIANVGTSTSVNTGSYGPDPEWGYTPPTNTDWGDPGGIGNYWDWGGGDWGGGGGIGDFWNWGGGDWGG